MTQSKTHYQLSIVEMDWILNMNIEPIQNEQRRMIAIFAEHKKCALNWKLLI